MIYSAAVETAAGRLIRLFLASRPDQSPTSHLFDQSEQLQNNGTIRHFEQRAPEQVERVKADKQSNVLILSEQMQGAARLYFLDKEEEFNST